MKYSSNTILIKGKVSKALLVLGFGVCLSAQAQTNPDKVHIGLVYPLSTHGSHAPLDTNHFSLHAIAGVSAQEEGVAIAGFSTVVKNNTDGVVVSGFSNHIGKRADGLLFAAFVNTYQEGTGFQFGGFSNVAKGVVKGGQFGGFLNVSGDLDGTQFAGFSNVAKKVTGTQFAGFINRATEVKGSQFAGFANVSGREIRGTQMAGFVNTAEDVDGSQLAGFINIAKRVRGAQIAGFINIADSSDHPIGIINIIRNGEKSVGMSIDETQTAVLSFRSGGKVLYGIIGAGYNFKNKDEVYAFEAGLGAHLFRTKSFRLNTEISTQYLEDFYPGEYFKSSLRVMPAIKFGGRLELFGGPVLNLVNSNTTEGKTMVDEYLWEHQNKWNDGFQGLYIGYTAGINIIF